MSTIAGQFQQCPISISAYHTRVVRDIEICEECSVAEVIAQPVQFSSHFLYLVLFSFLFSLFHPLSVPFSGVCSMLRFFVWRSLLPLTSS
jgi:hypothetical protein